MRRRRWYKKLCTREVTLPAVSDAQMLLANDFLRIAQRNQIEQLSPNFLRELNIASCSVFQLIYIKFGSTVVIFIATNRKVQFSTQRYLSWISISNNRKFSKPNSKTVLFATTLTRAGLEFCKRQWKTPENTLTCFQVKNKRNSTVSIIRKGLIINTWLSL